MMDADKLRARIIASVLRQVAEVPSSAKGSAIAAAVLSEIGLPEEECGLEINAATFLLLRSGLIESNTFDRVEQTLIDCAEMTLTASPALTQFMWAERLFRGTPNGDGIS